MPSHHVYVATHLPTLRHYVGKTSARPEYRWKHHRNDAAAGRHHCPLFHKALRKYGFEEFGLQVVESFETEREALDAEAWWIEFLRSTVVGYGFNVFRDGTGGAGHSVSEATRAKLRAANLGKKYSAEVRAKQSAMRTGRKLRPRRLAHSEAISRAHREAFASGKRVPATKGKVFSEETRAKMRKKHHLTDEQRDALRVAAAKRCSALWQDPEYRERRIKEISERAKTMWKDPAYRARMAEIHRGNNHRWGKKVEK